MIQLNPIAKEVQKTLLEKMRMSGKTETSISEPLSKTDGSTPSRNPDLSYLSQRTMWARMISLSLPRYVNNKKSLDAGEIVQEFTSNPPKPIVISGGEEIIEGMNLDANNPLANQPRSINGKLRTKGFGASDSVYDTDNYYRPMAGLKNISSRIKGDTKALKQVEISWQCWDFETLKRLTPYFLHPGASVGLEFGWMWPGHKPQELIYNNWAEIGPEQLTNIENLNVQLGKGNQEFIYGTVSNFNWEGADDGSFNCRTTITSPASNIFGETVGESEKGKKFEIDDTMKNQIRNERKWWRSRGQETTKVLEKNMAKVASDIIDDDPTIKNIPPRIFFDGLRSELINMATFRTPYDRGTQITNNPKYKNTIITEANSVEGYSDDNFEGPWVSYGWFEDNILNRFIGRINKEKNQMVSTIRSVYPIGASDSDGNELFQSVKIRNDSANLLTMDSDVVIIPGQFPYSLYFGEADDDKERQSRAMRKIERRVSELPPFAVGTQPDKNPKLVISKAQVINKSKLALDKIKQSAQDRIDSLTKQNEVGDKREFGYLRNLLINVKVIQEEFTRANTVEDGLMSMLKRVSDACGGVWDFAISTSEDGLSARVIEVNSNKDPVRALLRNSSADRDSGVPTENYNHDGLLVFPTWRTNSIVYNQSMTSKIPSGMQTAVVYGRNRSATEKSAGDPQANKKGVKLGELFSEFAGSKNDEKIGDAIISKSERVLGNDSFDAFGNNLQSELDPFFEPGVFNTEGYVGPLNLDEESQKPSMNIDKMLNAYTRKQIKEILDDGIDFDKEMKDESDYFVVQDDDKRDYKFLYTKKGIMRKSYKGAATYFLEQAPNSILQTNDILVPLEFEVTIDGTGGIHAGECFTSTHIPKRYRDAVAFQIVDVSHEVSNAGWKTKLKGLMRIDYGLGRGVEEDSSEVSDNTSILQMWSALKGDNTKGSGPDKPPYLSFMEYLNATKGQVSQYRFNVEEGVKERKRKNAEAVSKSNKTPTADDWDNDGVPNFIDPTPGKSKAKVKSKASKINSGANR